MAGPARLTCFGLLHLEWSLVIAFSCVTFAPRSFAPLKKPKTLILIAIIVLGIIQFIPLPGRENAPLQAGNDITEVLPIADGTKKILRDACYDCHSDEARYPWYASVAPLSWWIQHHVNEGREHLNYSRFGELSMSKRDHKLEESIEMVKKEEMPLGSYVVMHPEAKLSMAQRTALTDFFSSGIAGVGVEEENEGSDH